MIENITKRIFSNFWSQVFRDEKIKISINVLKKIPEIPWMRSREIDFLTDLLNNLKPERCLEWGAGYSSAYFSKLFSHDFHWISIEHDKEWAKKASSLVVNPNITIYHVAANNLNHTKELNDGTYEDYTDYIEFPSQFDSFDFIFIDGRARVECLKKALQLINPQGVVVIHDFNRPFYQKEVKEIAKGYAFLDWRKKSGGFWIYTNPEINLCNLIDVEHYQKLFSIYTSVGKRIKI